MKTKKIVDTSANRGEFNRAYKAHLEKTGKIHCGYCGYHKNENSDKKWYGGYLYDDMEICRGKRKGTNTRFPNWKLVSKNPKQWMPKPMRLETKTIHWNGKKYIDIKW